MELTSSAEYLIELDWRGPFSLVEIDQKSDRLKDLGLYQVYGTHPVYGPGVLLYIGLARKQTFAVRTGQHAWSGGSDPDPAILQVYIAVIRGRDASSGEKWHQDIGRAEKLLIHAHAPAYNSTHIMAINNEKDVANVRVLNRGACRSLQREVSGLMWTRNMSPLPALADEATL